jgi:UDP-2,3-diacylglucosamine hydrolase
MNDKYLFISDVHAGGFDVTKNKQVEKDFIQVLKWAKENSCKVFFLGDIFDYWMEFNNGYYPNEFDSLLESIFKVKESQTSVTMITGNHDNWTDRLFPKNGIEIEESFRIVSLNEKERVLLMHGDGLYQANGTLKRPLFHLILRNKLFVKFFKLLFPDRKGINIMKKFSLLNRKIRPTTDHSSAKLTKWFTNEFPKLDFDTVICGHDHTPRLIRHNNLKFLNLGAFFMHKTFALYTENELKLVVWNELANQPNLFESTDL